MGLSEPDPWYCTTGAYCSPSSIPPITVVATHMGMGTRSVKLIDTHPVSPPRRRAQTSPMPHYPHTVFAESKPKAALSKLELPLRTTAMQTRGRRPPKMQR
jgi:hypothetical protein